MSNKFSKGDKVAWQMGDGATMAGTVDFVGYDSYIVIRVDGGQCSPSPAGLRLASPADMLQACAWFGKLGK